MWQHGSRSSSSACGSADVLEALGVVIDLGPEVIHFWISVATSLFIAFSDYIVHMFLELHSFFRSVILFLTFCVGSGKVCGRCWSGVHVCSKISSSNESCGARPEVSQNQDCFQHSWPDAQPCSCTTFHCWCLSR